MAAVTIHSDFRAQENKVCHRFHCFHINLSWSAGAKCHDLPFFECWVLSQLVHFPLSLWSRGSLVPLHFLPRGWCHLLFWGYWYFPQQCWLQLVLHSAWHFIWCTLHIGFSDSSVGKESACDAEDPSSIPGFGRSAGEGIGYLLQFCWASLVV